jgi:hypothetical protein
VPGVKELATSGNPAHGPTTDSAGPRVKAWSGVRHHQTDLTTWASDRSSFAQRGPRQTAALSGHVVAAQHMLTPAYPRFDDALRLR